MRTWPNVKLPAGLLVYGSVDGEEWKVFHHVDSVYSEGEASIAKVDETFDKAYKARYIRITFSVLPHVYCDEIEILGRKNVDGAAESVREHGCQRPVPAGIHHARPV